MSGTWVLRSAEFAVQEGKARERQRSLSPAQKKVARKGVFKEKLVVSGQEES